MTEIESKIGLYNKGALNKEGQQRLLIKLIEAYEAQRVYIDQLERSTTEILENR